MKLLLRFFDAKGCSVASPHTVDKEDELLAYQTAIGFRNAVQQRVGVRVYMQVEETK